MCIKVFLLTEYIVALFLLYVLTLSIADVKAAADVDQEALPISDMWNSD